MCQGIIYQVTILFLLSNIMIKNDDNPYYNEIRTSNINIAILKNIALEKIKQHNTADELNEVERLVNLAALTVLGDITPYLAGSKHLSEKEINQIGNEYEKIKLQIGKKAKETEEKCALRAQKVAMMIYTLRERSIDSSDSISIQKALAEYYQVMGCFVSYGKWKVGDEFEGPRTNFPNYEVGEIIKNSKGLQIVVLTPNGEGPDGLEMPPIFCCRGTVSTNLHNILDDMNKHIGQYSFQESKEQIREALNDITKEYGSAVIAGHSLGGAIAQVITGEYCDLENDDHQPLIKSTYYYNAPGVGGEIAGEYEKKLKQLDRDKRPKVFRYYHKSDLISLTGGAHLKADETYEVGQYSLSPKIIRAAHSLPALISQLGSQMVNTETSQIHRAVKATIEGFRYNIAKFSRGILLGKIEAKQKLKALAKQVSAFKSSDHSMRGASVVAYHEEQKKLAEKKAASLES